MSEADVGEMYDLATGLSILGSSKFAINQCMAFSASEAPDSSDAASARCGEAPIMIKLEMILFLESWLTSVAGLLQIIPSILPPRRYLILLKINVCPT